MADDITVNELRQLIALNLASESDIPAEKHREVENKIIDYVVQEFAKVAKSKVLLLEAFTTDRNYSVATGLPSGVKIDSVVVMLVCQIANSGFNVGDTVNASTSYPADNGRTAAQGIGVQYNNVDSSSIKVVVNKQVTIMSSYNSASNATAGNILMSGINMNNWFMKLIVGYK